MVRGSRNMTSNGLDVSMLLNGILWSVHNAFPMISVRGSDRRGGRVMLSFPEALLPSSIATEYKAGHVPTQYPRAI